jgi:hypothetical protein
LPAAGRGLLALEADEPERHVDAALGPLEAEEAEHREQLLEVQALAAIDDVQRAREAVLPEAVQRRRQIARGVERGAVLGLDQHRRLLAGDLHDLGALALADQPLLLEHREDLGHLVLVLALAGHERELDAEELVDALELAPRGVAELLPARAHLGLAVLEPLEPGPALAVEGRVGLHRLAEPHVQRVQRGDVERRVLGAPPRIGGEQHAVGGAPVAEVVDADDGVAERGVELRQRVADHRRADVVIREVLGDVRRRVVDAHRLAGAARGEQHRRVVDRGREQAERRHAIDLHVDEGPGGGGVDDEAAARQVAGEARGDRRRLLAVGEARQRERRHGEVAELGARRRIDLHVVGSAADDSSDSARQLGGAGIGGNGHGGRNLPAICAAGPVVDENPSGFAVLQFDPGRAAVLPNDRQPWGFSRTRA